MYQEQAWSVSEKTSYDQGGLPPSKKRHHFDEAEYNFEEAYFLAPDDVEALLGLAKALEQAERWRKSRNYYMELIDKDPSDSQYYYGVYRTYFGEGRLEDAQEYLQKATQLRNSGN